MTEAKQQEAGRTRFLLLPPLSAAEREAERAEGKLQQSGDRSIGLPVETARARVAQMAVSAARPRSA
jgi:hypothetical protein